MREVRLSGPSVRASLAPRWLKLLRDLRGEKGRVLLMMAAILVSLAAVGAVLGGFAVLTREIAVNYLGTHPASATLELDGGVDAAAIGEALRHPAVANAEARDVVLARARVGADWRPLLLFVVEDFAHLRLNTFRPESGAWPPPEGTMLIERAAIPMLQAGPGKAVWVKTPLGAPREVPITGLVHDPGLAPAWQERQGYGYITRATLALLGEAPVLHELRIAFRDDPVDLAEVESAAADVAARLGKLGRPVHEIRVPPPRQHPHQKQMVTILFLLLAFSVMALGLSAVLVANSLAAMLARQVREIGVMKTLGARTAQIAALYVALVAGLGAVALLLAMPLGVLGARVLARAVSGMLNFDLTSISIPAWVFAVQAAAGVIVPLLVAAIPIGRASRIPAREAIDRQGAATGALRVRLAMLPPVLRNILRRPARLALTLALLSAGGAMFMTALNVSLGWERNLEKIYETRFYDVEIRLRRVQPVALAESLRGLPGVRHVESWGYSPAAYARPGRIDVVRTYPDRGHGSLAVLAPPPATSLIRFPLMAGRWLRPGDTGAVVLNHAALAQAPLTKVGDPVVLSLDGQVVTWKVVGIVEEIGSAGVAYVSDEEFARATGTPGSARLLRIATSAGSPEERIATIRAIESSLAQAGIGVEAAMPFSELRTAVGDHVDILIRALVALAAVMAVVGILGLGAAMGTSVLERTREFGVMKTVGATPRRLKRMIVGEALATGALSAILALALSVPLTAAVDWLVGILGFLAPLPFVLSPGAALLWLVLVGAASLVATLLPARRVARLSIRDALDRI